MSSNNEIESSRVWTNYLKNATKFSVSYRSICRKAYEIKDATLIKNLIKLLRSHKNYESSLIGAYTSLLTFYLHENQLDQCLDALNEIIAHGTIGYVHSRELETIRRECRRAGIEFPNVIKNTKTK